MADQKARKTRIKVYAVMQAINLPGPAQPGARVLAVKLTRGAAEAVRDAHPGTWVEKHVASK